MGNPLIGVPTQDMTTSLFGKVVAVSSLTGQRLIVGAPTHGFATPLADDSQVNQDGGGVFLYEFEESSATWELIWFLPGRKGEALGSAVAMSEHGTRIALRRRRGGALDFVEVYDIQGRTGKRVGNPIGCMGGGTGLSLAPSGNRLAVSCESFDSERGRVEVFDYDGSTWIPSGVFEGKNTGDLYGWNTSFSADGNRLAISAPSYSFDAERTRCGMAQVYEFKNDGLWSQVGGNLVGYSKFEGFGMSLDLSGDGRTVVAGSPGSTSNGLTRAGTVRAFFDFRGIWMQTGSDISGTEVGDQFGEAISVSHNGGRLAASSPNHGSFSGHVRIFDLYRGEWTQHGKDIEGLKGGTRLGYGRSGISLTGDGRRLAYGSPFCGLTGCVHVVDYEKTSSEQPEAEQPITVRDDTDESRTAGKLDWDIAFVDVSVHFNEEETAFVEVEYEIHSKSNRVTVYDAECEEPLPTSLITLKTKQQPVASDREALTVELSMEFNDLVESPMYTEPESGTGLLALCIRVDLVDQEMVSVAFDQRRLSIFFDNSVNFEVVDVNVDETPQHTSVKASVDYSINACRCDESFNCVDTPLGKDADTLICISTEMEGVRVASVEKLQFFKGSLTQEAVHLGQEDDLTIVSVHKDILVVRTRLVSAFFEGNNELGIHARGTCTLSRVRNGEERLLLVDAAQSGFSVDLSIETAESSARKLISFPLIVTLGVALSTHYS